MDTEATIKHTVKYTYRGIDIVYDEDDNRWEFALDGRERYAASLKNAKATIDTPPKEKTEKPFKRQKVYFSRYNSPFEEGEATSVAAETRYGGPAVWVVTKHHGRNVRDKMPVNSVFPVTPENKVLIDHIQSLQAEERKAREAFDNQITATRAKLTKLTIN